MSKNHEAGWAVVTGASSGLGALFAEKLAQRGMPLLLAGRDHARLTEVQQRVRRLAPDVDVELAVRRSWQSGGRRRPGRRARRPGGGRPGQQCGVRHLRAAVRDRSGPGPRAGRRQRRRGGASDARGAAGNAGTRAWAGSERRVDHCVSARAVSGHLWGFEGLRAVVQPSALGRDAGLGGDGDGVVPRPDAHRLRRGPRCRRVADGRLPPARFARTGGSGRTSGDGSRTTTRRARDAEPVDGERFSTQPRMGGGVDQRPDAAPRRQRREPCPAST